MGLEQRNGRPYYYAKRRIGDRVVSEYRGRGILATILDEQQAMRQIAKAQRRAEVRAVQDAIHERARAVLQCEDDVRTLAAAVLIVNGFVQHKRQWRKGAAMANQLQRMQTLDTVPISGPDDMDDGAAALRALREAIVDPMSSQGKKPASLVQRAAAERLRREAVRNVLNANPHIWLRARTELGTVTGRILTMTRDQVSRDVLTYHLAAMRSALGYETAPLLEQLLIEQVVIAWLDLDTVQRQYAGQVMENHTPREGMYFDRRVTSAQARFLRASESLARIRRLAMPVPLQVNIGDKQINVAGVVPAQQPNRERTDLCSTNP